MRWFLPGKIARPAHLPPLPITGEVALKAGPDGKRGRIVGGLYQLGEPGWVQIDGWWINATDSKPSNLLRLDAREGTTIDGADAGHRWLVPVLLRPVAGGLIWHGQERLGTDGWKVPAPPANYAAVGYRVRAAILDRLWSKLGEQGTTDLAVDLLCLNYHLIRAELVASGWVNKTLVKNALHAAVFEGASDG